MSKLIICRGLPASGKSTWAEEQRALAPATTRVVTMDDIRTAIGSVFEQGDEPIVQSIRDYTIRRYLGSGYCVISADTNLPERVVRRLTSIAEDDDVPVEIQDFRDVSLEVCLERNAVRHSEGDFKVPDDAIRSMYDRYIKNT